MNETIGVRLRQARTKAGLTQRGLAKKIGVSHVTIQNWEHDVYAPSSAELISLCELFGVSADWLLVRSETEYADCISYIREEENLNKLLSINNEVADRLSALSLAG